MRADRLLRIIATHSLNRSAPIRALGRFLRWQLISRAVPGPHTVPFIDETCLVMENGMAGATSNYYTGLAEVEGMGFALHALRPGDLFCDIGANVGAYTVLAHAAGAIPIAFEPIPLTFERLQRNVRANGIAAELHNCGLSSEAGVRNFTTDLDAVNRVTEDGVPLEVRTLDEAMGSRAPFMLKIDVEGHELDVLAGAKDTLARASAVLIETISNAQTIDSVLVTHGFQAFVYDPLARKLSPSSGPQYYKVYLKDLEGIQQRCTGARRFKLVNGSI